MSTVDLASLVSRLEAVATRLENSAGGGDAGGGAAMVTDFETEFIMQAIDPFIAESAKIPSSEVKEAAGLLKQLALEQKKFLKIVSESSEPSQEVIGKLLKPLTEVIQQIGEIKSKMFKDKVYSNFIQSINDGVIAFAWVTVKPAPVPYVKECGNAIDFYANRIRKEGTHKTWANLLKAVFTSLADYVKKHHNTGLNWSKDTKIATLEAAKSAPAPAARAPPPPPPPGAAPVSTKSAPAKPAADVGALLTQISKGLSVTSGLKKVSDDMKTHKNPALRAEGATPYKAPAASARVASVAKPTTAVKPKTPLLALQGKKWIVEHQSGKNELLISETKMNQTVYVYKCENCTLVVKGKVNQIILDNCKKTNVVFDTVVSSLEFVNCQSVKGQVTGLLPTASIEKTDGCLLYLSNESINCQIITAKSSEMNISIQKDGDGDYVEFPIVEQFRTLWNGKTFITEPTDSTD